MDLRMLLLQTIEATKGIGRALFLNLLWLAKNKEARGGHAKIKEEDRAKHLFEDITDKLDPDKLFQETHQKHADAKAEFDPKKLNVQVSDYDEFVEKVSDYMMHHLEKVNGKAPTREAAYAKFTSVLQHTEHYKNIATAYKAAKNQKGELDRIIGEVIHVLGSIDEQEYTSGVIGKVDPTDHDLQAKLMELYMERHGNLLPKKYKKKKPEEIAHEYASHLQHHARRVKFLRDTLTHNPEAYANRGQEDGHGH